MRTSLVTSYNYSLDQQFYTPLNHRHLRSCLSRNRGFVYKDIDAAPCRFLSRRISFYISFLLRTSICEKIFNPRCLYLRPDSSEPGSGGKCNFGPVFGKLYTDGLTDTDAAVSCPGNCVVQHQRETYQRSLITTYHHKKAQIRNKRGRRCTIAGIVIARIRTAVVDFTRTSSCPS